MSCFKITYPSGKFEYVQTDAVDVADQANRTFGRTLEEVAELGAAIDCLGDIALEDIPPNQMFDVPPEPAAETPAPAPAPVEPPAPPAMIDAGDGTQVPNPFAPAPVAPEPSVEELQTLTELVTEHPEVDVTKLDPNNLPEGYSIVDGVVHVNRGVAESAEGKYISGR